MGKMDTLLGVGLYTIPEAARLTRIRPDRIRRWTQGYASGAKKARRRHPPVLESQLERIADTPAIGFLDLMEIRFVNAFVDMRVPLKRVRAMADLAREVWGQEHPFATRRFLTDGRDIFAQVADADGKANLLNSARQFAMFEIIEPTLLDGVEFDEAGIMNAWRPVPDHARRIVCDPLRSFGEPVDDASGVPADALVSAFIAEGSAQTAAASYEVDVEAVEHAVRFDFEIRQAA